MASVGVLGFISLSPTYQAVGACVEPAAWLSKHDARRALAIDRVCATCIGIQTRMALTEALSGRRKIYGAADHHLRADHGLTVHQELYDARATQRRVVHVAGGLACRDHLAAHPGIDNWLQGPGADNTALEGIHDRVFRASHWFIRCCGFEGGEYHSYAQNRSLETTFRLTTVWPKFTGMTAKRTNVRCCAKGGQQWYVTACPFRCGDGRVPVGITRHGMSKVNGKVGAPAPDYAALIQTMCLHASSLADRAC